MASSHAGVTAALFKDPSSFPIRTTKRTLSRQATRLPPSWWPISGFLMTTIRQLVGWGPYSIELTTDATPLAGKDKQVPMSDNADIHYDRHVRKPAGIDVHRGGNRDVGEGHIGHANGGPENGGPARVNRRQ